MGWIIAILAVSFVMAVMTIAELRQSVRASTVELIIADRAIAAFVLGTFTVAIVGLILIAANALP